MSKASYVSDGIAIISIQGLRMATKSDRLYADKGGKDYYYLELEYKGTKKEIFYLSKEMRDETFNKLSSILTKEKEGVE